MGVENGQWIMRGMDWNDPFRIRTWQELIRWIDEVGFLPLFANEVEGFSAEEHVSSDFWWTGDREQDPWEWREIIAGSHQAAYGKFFNQKAGFISPEWLPVFANFRRGGYDFDSRWEDGLANRREKKIMDVLTGRDRDGDVTFPAAYILSADLKKRAGFGGDGEKNFSGIITGLQMQTYLVTADFQKKRNKRGEAYGMAVSVMLPPEAVWGYEAVTSAYGEKPENSWLRIMQRVKELYPRAVEADIVKLIGKKPAGSE